MKNRVWKLFSPKKTTVLKVCRYFPKESGSGLHTWRTAALSCPPVRKGFSADFCFKSSYVGIYAGSFFAHFFQPLRISWKISSTRSFFQMPANFINPEDLKGFFNNTSCPLPIFASTMSPYLRCPVRLSSGDFLLIFDSKAHRVMNFCW